MFRPSNSCLKQLRRKSLKGRFACVNVLLRNLNFKRFKPYIIDNNCDPSLFRFCVN